MSKASEEEGEELRGQLSPRSPQALPHVASQCRLTKAGPGHRCRGSQGTGEGLL